MVWNLRRKDKIRTGKGKKKVHEVSFTQFKVLPPLYYFWKEQRLEDYRHIKVSNYVFYI